MNRSIFSEIINASRNFFLGINHCFSGNQKARVDERNPSCSPLIKKSWRDLKAIFHVSLLFPIFLLTLGAGSMKSESDEIQLVGRVYVMGNEPLTQVALKLDDGQVYVLLGDRDKELRGLQGKRLSVVGKPSEEKPRGAKAIIVKSFKVLESK
jgi:hypothetical protein